MPLVHTPMQPGHEHDGEELKRWLSLWLWLLLPWVATTGAVLVCSLIPLMDLARVISLCSMLAPGWKLTQALASWPWPPAAFERGVALLSIVGVWAGWLYSLAELGKL